jgi:hypothetical protein
MLLIATLALAAMTSDDIMERAIAATRTDTAAWHARITLLKHTVITKNEKPDGERTFLLFGADENTLEQLRRHGDTTISDALPQQVNIEIPRIITERAACYVFSFAKPATNTLNGRAVYVLAFTPRVSACHVDDGDEERIALLTAGTVWIDQERFCIWKLEGHLSKPIVKRFIVTLGSIYACDVAFEQTAVGDLIVPSHLQTFVQYESITKGKQNERRVIVYDTPAPRAP